MSEVSSPQGVGGGGGVYGGGGGGGGDGGGGGGGGAQVWLHWLWQPAPHQGSPLPQKPHWLQQRQLGQSAPPAWLPHCCPEAESMEAKEKMIKVQAVILSYFKCIAVDEVRVGYK